LKLEKRGEGGGGGGGFGETGRNFVTLRLLLEFMLKIQLKSFLMMHGTNFYFFLPGSNEKVVLIAVAGRSNGLGPVLSGNTPFSVINCPPVKPENVAQDIWSSLNVPSGEPHYCTVLHQEVSLSTSTPISILEAFGLSLC
jgi:hypothetical protein